MFFLSLPVILLSPPAAAGPRGNIAFGSGEGKQSFADNYKVQTLGGHAELSYKLFIFQAGIGFVNISEINIGEERRYVNMGYGFLGFSLGRFLDVHGGLGGGSWRRKELDTGTTPDDYDYRAYGAGYMIGARLYLLNFKDLSVGISGTYFKMTSDGFKSIEDGTTTMKTEESVGSGTVAAIVFAFTPGKGGKR
jgi:hypothetical protein